MNLNDFWSTYLKILNTHLIENKENGSKALEIYSLGCQLLNLKCNS